MQINTLKNVEVFSIKNNIYTRNELYFLLNEIRKLGDRSDRDSTNMLKKKKKIERKQTDNTDFCKPS